MCYLLVIFLPRKVPDSAEACFDELKSLGYEVRLISAVHWKIGTVSYYPTRGTVVVEGRNKEPEKGFICLLKVLEREGLKQDGQDEKASPAKPKRQPKAEDFAKLKIQNPAVPECVNFLKMARAIVSSDRLSDPERAWVAEIIRLREAFELDSISFKDEKRLIMLYRRATRILKPS
jgi:hypothetical protein